MGFHPWNWRRAAVRGVATWAVKMSVRRRRAVNLVGRRWKNRDSRRQVVNLVGKVFCRRDCLVHGGRGGHVYLGGESGEGVGVAFTLGLGDPHAISVVVFVCGSDVPAVHGVQCP